MEEFLKQVCKRMILYDDVLDTVNFEVSARNSNACIVSQSLDIFPETSYLAEDGYIVFQQSVLLNCKTREDFSHLSICFLNFSLKHKCHYLKTSE